ncbi:SpoIIE family protein phosphatase [Streptomyces sp. 8N616]|uniref:SpoIIE family protein phosphatase n=1 Tax=Streptomyces sp. 8N616 TaxID=3457414 RepID=UPI003FD2CD0C
MVRTNLPGNPLAPATARRFVRVALADWAELRLPSSEVITDRLAEDAALLVSEMVTNAVVHAGTDVELVCRLVAAGEEDGGAAGLVVEVSDRHAARPVGSQPPPAGEYGRGLQLVGALAESWGVSYRRGLKTVWFRLTDTEPDGADGRRPGWDSVFGGAMALPAADPGNRRPVTARAQGGDWGRQAGDWGRRPDWEQGSDWDTRGALSFLAEASDLLAGQFDEDMVAALAGQLLVPRLADWCAVWLDDEAGRAPGSAPRLARVWHAQESRIEAFRAALEKNPPVLGEAVRGWPVPWPWPATEPETPGSAYGLQPWEEDGGSALACRLFAGARSVGTLLLGRESPARIPDEVGALIEDFARRVALAILSARQYTREATTSLVLQKGLRPRGIAPIPGVTTHVVYEPAGEGAWAGGDFYDIFQAGEGRWCFALGDVCGNGSEAAVVTGLVRPWLKLLAHEGYSVGGVLDRLNRMLMDDATQAAEAAAPPATADAGSVPWEAPQVRFLSLVYGELVAAGDGPGMRCTLASAGHPLPLLLLPDGEVRPAATPQLLLGVQEDTAYESQTFHLRPGDTLLSVTDGVTERRSGQRQFDDGGGLAAALAGCVGLGAAGVAERIRRAVHEFGETPPDDDLALLVLHAGDLAGRATPR